MIRVNCPKCGETVEVDESRGAGRKKFRLVCGTCNSRFSIKAAPASPATDGESEEDSTLVSMPPGMEEPFRSTVRDPPRRIPSRDDPRIEPDTRGLEKQLEARRSVWSSNNSANVPTTLSFHEDEEGGLDPSTATGSAPPEGLDAPTSLSSEGYDSESSGGFEDLADAEIELPGDPDEESVDQRSIDLEVSEDGEEPSGAGDSLAADPEAAPEPDPEPPDAPDRLEEPEAAVDEPPGDAGLMGMSVELDAPIPSARRAPAVYGPAMAAEPSAPPPGKPDRPSRSNVLEDVIVSNLAIVAGYRIEPIGMVTHHFCRQGGGDGDEARKRVRAFGIRYRRGLEALAEQAQKLGGNAVLGVEITLQPTGSAADPVVWVLVQGTAVRLTRG